MIGDFTDLTVRILAPSEIELAYRSYPWLLLSLLTTEAVRPLAVRLHDEVGFACDCRLFSSMISATVELGAAEGPKGRRGRNVVVADDYTLWWEFRPSRLTSPASDQS